MAVVPATVPEWVLIALGALAFQVGLILYALAQRRRRLNAERVDAESRERLALISSMSGFGFWSWDAATDRVWASKHARSVLGVDGDAPLMGKTLLGALHPEDRTRVLYAIRETAHADDTMERELRLIGKGGETRWITAKARTYRELKGAANRGPVRRVTGYVVDDSQRKRTAAELQKLEQKLTHLSRVALLGELSGALAHELQQPLTAILCNVQAVQILLAKDPPRLEELREILQEIVSEDKHAGLIIQRLRALLMRKETHFQRMEIRDLFRDVLALARGTLMERNVQLTTRIDDVIPAVQGDRIELQQVLLNLIVNACESMSANPARDRRIEIVAALDAGHGAVLASVLDCGAGIDPNQLERVFEPFFTTKEQGLGLGLSICQSIIAAHGGRLWATNRSDRGTGVHFTLPILAEGFLERSPKEEPADSPITDSSVRNRIGGGSTGTG
jgi:two-component system, LuxR family, sensor kinase FixL